MARVKISRVSIIVPVFNERATVGEVIGRLRNLEMAGVGKEIIVVDDGSIDGSREWLRRQSKSKSFKYVFHKQNMGKGAAMQTGLSVATGDYVIIQDADLEYNPGEIGELVKKAGKEDLLVVYGSRDRDIKNYYRSPHYYWGSKVLSKMINWLFHQNLTDPETCYKLVQTDLMRFLHLEERGFGVEIEISAKLSRLGIPIGETSISYAPRSFEEGKKIRTKDGLRAVWLVAKYFLNDLHYGVVDRVLRLWREKEAMGGVEVDKRQTWVDVGCGRQAHLGWRIRKAVGKYVGVDMEVKDGKMGNMELIRADAHKFAQRIKSPVDVVAGLAIIEHLDHPEKFLREVRKVLRKGGKLVLTTPAPWSDGILKLMVFLGLIDGKEITDHKTYFTLERLRVLLEREGFEVVQQKMFGLGTNGLTVAREIV